MGLLLGVALALLIGAGITGARLLFADDDSGPKSVAPSATPTPTSEAPDPTKGPAFPEGCEQQAKRPFVPTMLTIDGVTENAPVLALQRDAQGVPGVPALSAEAKLDFAWDEPGIKPGSRKGNVLMNTHTWPDGTAMGNKLLDGLQEGDLMRVANDSEVLCYRVTEREEVSIENPPLDKVYDFDGKPQLVMIVCSGERIGPGQWTHRTLWFASPVRAA